MNARQKQNILRIIKAAATAAVKEADRLNDEAARVSLADPNHRRPGGSTWPTAAWHEASSYPSYWGREEELVADLERSASKEDVEAALYGFRYVPPGMPAHCGPELPEYAVRLAYRLAERR